MIKSTQQSGQWAAPRPLKSHTGAVPPGSLIVSDVFQGSDLDSHGGAVVSAARSVGYSGSIFTQQAAGQSVPELEEAYAATELIATPGMSSQALLKAINKFAVGPPIHMLKTGAEEVQRANQSGASHSVLNLSSGTCKAQVTNMLYGLAKGPEVATNYAGLFDLDLQKLSDPDPSVSALERHKLQQSLVDAVDKAWGADPRLASLGAEFANSVKEFESRKNSVVIAAGNEGLIQPRLEQSTGGTLRVPADFEQNVLECQEVTSVGATIILDGVEAPARYSSHGPGVDVYASGDKVMGREFDPATGLADAGTSIAAPRIAGVMAELHLQNSELGSEGVEQLLGEFTGPLSMLDVSGAQRLFDS